MRSSRRFSLACALVATVCGSATWILSDDPNVSQASRHRPDVPVDIAELVLTDEQAAHLLGVLGVPPTTTTTTTTTTMAVRRAPHGPYGHASDAHWDAIAQCETGSDWTAHGTKYSTALGILNAAVREHATVEVAARVFAGTATRVEQIAIANSIYDRYGPGAWACKSSIP